MTTQRNRTTTTIALTLGLIAANGAHAEAVVEKGQIRTEDHIYQILDKDLASIKFAEGSAVLADSDMANISAFVKATYNESKVDRYLVAAWADKDYPDKGELSTGQRKLAALRAAHIKDALTAAGAGKIDIFEMTKQPNWIQRAFGTETAEIKNKGANITSHQKLLKEIGTRLHDKGGAHMAVIVAKFKDEVAVN